MTELRLMALGEHPDRHCQRRLWREPRETRSDCTNRATTASALAWKRPLPFELLASVSALIGGEDSGGSQRKVLRREPIGSCGGTSCRRKPQRDLAARASAQRCREAPRRNPTAKAAFAYLPDESLGLCDVARAWLELLGEIRVQFDRARASARARQDRLRFKPPRRGHCLVRQPRSKFGPMKESFGSISWIRMEADVVWPRCRRAPEGGSFGSRSKA